MPERLSSFFRSFRNEPAAQGERNLPTSEESPSETEGEMSGEEVTDIEYLNSLYVLLDGAIAQHLDPLIAQLEQDITKAWQEQKDRDQILILENIHQRLIQLTARRRVKTYQDTIITFHQIVRLTDLRERQEAILAVWLSDNVLTIDAQARRYKRGEADGARDPHLKTLFDQLIAQLDATVTDILTKLQVELIGEYRAIVRYEPKSHELRYSRNIAEGQPVKIVVRGAKFNQSETALIKPTVKPLFQS
jgi:hypothetical protein